MNRLLLKLGLFFYPFHNFFEVITVGLRLLEILYMIIFDVIGDYVLKRLYWVFQSSCLYIKKLLYLN
jgi:hypothetical protein